MPRCTVNASTGLLGFKWSGLSPIVKGIKWTKMILVLIVPGICMAMACKPVSVKQRAKLVGQIVVFFRLFLDIGLSLSVWQRHTRSPSMVFFTSVDSLIKPSLPAQCSHFGEFGSVIKYVLRYNLCTSHVEPSFRRTCLSYNTNKPSQVCVSCQHTVILIYTVACICRLYWPFNSGDIIYTTSAVDSRKAMHNNTQKPVIARLLIVEQ